MPRSNRKAHSRGNTQRTRYSTSAQPEVKLTKAQIEQDKADQKKFFMILGGLTLVILVIIYLLFF